MKTSTWDIYSRSLRYYAPYRRAIGFGIILTLLLESLSLLKPWPLQYVIDEVLGEGSQHGSRMILTWMCIALVLIHLVGGGLNLAKNTLMIRIALEALLRLRCQLFEHLHRLSLRYHDTKGSSDSIYRVSYDAQAIQSVFNGGVEPVFRCAVTLIGTFSVMFWMDWSLSLLALAIVPLLVFTIYYYADRVRSDSKDISQKESLVMSRAQEGMTGIRIIHAFGREEYELNRFEEECQQSLLANIKLTMTQMGSAMMVSTLTALGTSGMIYLGSLHVLDGTLTTGKILVFITYLGSLYGPLQTLSQTTMSIARSAAGAQRVFEVLDTTEEVVDPVEGKNIDPVAGKIELRHVSFGYDDKKMILKDVSMVIPAGSRTAVVGATGTGKTTLMSLIPRFYDPNQGEVLLDDINLKEIKRKPLRSRISMVLQDTMLLTGTIAENIGYGKLGATRAEIEKASRMAQVHQFVLQQPKGYDTEVGERGVRLSVGQRQRIGIARAFLKDAPILLLDEPTSALDPETESEIMTTLAELMKGRTTVIITHRIGTIHHSDRIIVLEEGRVVECGTGQELLGTKGAYSRLYLAQRQEKEKAP